MDFSKVTYHASNKFQLLSVILFTVLGVPIGIIIGSLYAFFSIYCPIVILNVLLIVGVAFILMLVVDKLSKLAVSRNPIINVIMAFVVCLFAYYANIVTFEFLLVDFYDGSVTWLTLFMDPAFVYDTMVEVVLPEHVITITSGSSRSSGFGISGIFLLLLYIVEFIIFIYPAFLVRKVDYFCENCQKWYKNVVFFSISNDNLLTSIEQSPVGNYSNALSNIDFYKTSQELTSLITPDEKKFEILYYQYCQCPNCRQNSILNIVKKALVKEKKKFALKTLPKGNFISDTYIDNATEQLFAKQKDKLY